MTKPIDAAPLAAAAGRVDAVLAAAEVAFLRQLLVGTDPRLLDPDAPLWTPHAVLEVARDEFERELAPEQALEILRELEWLPGDPLATLEPEIARRYRYGLSRVLQNVTEPLWWIIELPRTVELCRSPPGPGTSSSVDCTVFVAVDGDGRMCCWPRRGRADDRARGEFLARLARCAETASALAIGLESEYSSAALRLGDPERGRLVLVDPRAALESARPSLFREEVMRARARRLDGDVLVAQPLPLRLVTAGFALFVVAALALIGFGRVARTHAAEGVLMPASGSVRIATERGGVLARLAVEPGAEVARGALIAELRSANVDADGAEVEARVEHELTAAIDALARERDAAVAEHAVERGRLDAGLRTARHNAADAARQEQLQQRRRRSFEERLARSRELAERGVIARVALQELEEQALGLEVQELALARERHAADTALFEARARAEQQPLTDVQRESAFEQRRTELEQRLAQARLARGARVHAPRAGRVAAVLVRPGQTLAPGEALVVLVDDDAPLEGEMFLPSRAIGFVRVGQRVRLELDAFPYQRYGRVEGRVVDIASAAVRRSAVDPEGARSDEPVYRVRVEIARQHIAAPRGEQRLRAGMRFNGDVVIDRPRIVEWLIEPLATARR